jgi:SAM-dependent methyltransferase
MAREGWHGWDEYAPFYDWENARTLGRRDVPFWRRLAARADGLVLELGCGTGRISLPLARAGAALVGVDRSQAMLSRAARRTRALRAGSTRQSRHSPEITLVRGDIRDLPFRSSLFSMVLAPYGVLQSLVRETDLAAALQSAARVLRPGGTFGIDLVPDVPNWREYDNRVQMRGRAPGGVHLTLIESVHQDPRRRLTTFAQRFVISRGPRKEERQFELTFRTLSIRQTTARLERAGFAVDAILGDYHGRPWDERADVWIILARRT